MLAGRVEAATWGWGCGCGNKACQCRRLKPFSWLIRRRQQTTRQLIAAAIFDMQKAKRKIKVHKRDIRYRIYYKYTIYILVCMADKHVHSRRLSADVDL